MLLRVSPAADGHFAAMYERTSSYQVTGAVFGTIDSGRPLFRSKASPRLAAWRSSDRKVSASAFVRRVRDFSLPPTTQRISYETVLLDLFRRTSQNLTSVDFTPPPGDSPARR